jgi:hypothetical protein
MDEETRVIGTRARPHWMRASAEVDLDQLQCSIRPAIRSQVRGRLDRSEIRRWARRAGLFAVVEKDGFFSMSRNASSARRVLRMDARPGRHTNALGRALGYPFCCCLAAAHRKEEGLDDWARAMSSRRFVGLFRLIDPKGYIAGRANISHVPCSPRCLASLRMARALSSEANRERGRKEWSARRQRPLAVASSAGF